MIMEDQRMFRLLELQYELNEYLKTNFRRNGRVRDETFKRIFFEYSRMLKSSIFRAEVSSVERKCFYCDKSLFGSFYELDCLHLVCAECKSNKNFYSSLETAEDTQIFRCLCSMVTKVSDIKPFGIG